jgi:hypothetical protein
MMGGYESTREEQEEAEEAKGTKYNIILIFYYNSKLLPYLV